LYQNGERMAMLYLAREYFESEEIKHYIEKIDAALQRAQPPRRSVAASGQAPPVIIAASSPMRKALSLAEHVAESEMTVLLTGATGAGKDLLARYIHYCSGRTGEFVSINAAAIPDPMVESELFGSARGAFTGSRDRRGLIEQAENGTLYLNEISDASPELQAKLLEVLETRQVRRLGENKTRTINFRLIAASNQDLQQRMRDNQFRPDLYHRLNEIPIHLAPLEERAGDIPALVEYFLTSNGLAPTDGDSVKVERLGGILSARRWPGNVRQLKAEVQRLWVTSPGDIGRMIAQAEHEGDGAEGAALLEALERTGWNRREAARELGVSEATVRRWITKHHLAEQIS
ncbi:MAG: sigma 54-interacting transcriptional regulator, partial [Candidatus Zixiibacteriota bacterium]